VFSQSVSEALLVYLPKNFWKLPDRFRFRVRV